MIVLNVSYKCRPGLREAFLNAIRAEGLDAASRAEAGNLQYDYFLPEGDSDGLLLVEKWRDAEALAEHGKQPHFARLGEIKPRYVTDTQVEKFQAPESGAPFREMRRFRQALSREECAAILRAEKRGTLAVIGDGGRPYAVPLNYWYDEEADSIYFHCAKEGHKLDAIRACGKVCFTVYDAGESAGDWSYYVKSVIAFGHAALVEDDAEKSEKARQFGAKYFPTQQELEQELLHLDRMALVKIGIEHMTGKRVHEK